MDYELLIAEINDSFLNMIFTSTDFSSVTFTDITIQFCALPVLVPFLISKESKLRVRNLVRYEFLIMFWYGMLFAVLEAYHHFKRTSSLHYEGGE
jgi:hypothetical protein